MTEITYIDTTMQPTEMWVDGRTAGDYPDFDIVEYTPPPKWLKGCYSGKVRIRKRGGSTIHRWSPQLVALHAAVIKAVGENTPRMFGPGLRGRRLAASKDFEEGHHRLYSGDLDFHGTLTHPLKGEFLEDVQARVVSALQVLASTSSSKGGRAAWSAVATAVGDWAYREHLLTPEE